jgi:hypothetical protein
VVWEYDPYRVQPQAVVDAVMKPQVSQKAGNLLTIPVTVGLWKTALERVRCDTWLPQCGRDQTFRERNVVVILLSWWGNVFLIFRCDIILHSLIACVATFGLLPLAAEHLACAQLCAEAHSDDTLLFATWKKKAKNLPLKLLRYAFEAECTDTAVTLALDWMQLTGWMLQSNCVWRPLRTPCRRHPSRPTRRPPCIPPLPPQRFFRRWMPTFIFLVRVLSVSLCVVISRSVVE